MKFIIGNRHLVMIIDIINNSSGTEQYIHRALFYFFYTWEGRSHRTNIFFNVTHYPPVILALHRMNFNLKN